MFSSLQITAPLGEQLVPVPVESGTTPVPVAEATPIVPVAKAAAEDDDEIGKGADDAEADAWRRIGCGAAAAKAERPRRAKRENCILISGKLSICCSECAF
jgi:hypothetical protein